MCLPSHSVPDYFDDEGEEPLDDEPVPAPDQYEELPLPTPSPIAILGKKKVQLPLSHLS